MKKTKRVITLFLLALTLCSVMCLSGCEEEKLKPTERFFVNDFADVIDPTDEDKMFNRGVDIEEKTKAQIVVTTIDSLNGDEISDYALTLGRDWGIGDKNKNNGVLILLSKDDREIYIAVGYGLEGALPDSKTGRLLDNYAIPYLKEDNFSIGLLKTYNAVANEVCLEYGIPTDIDYVPVEQLPQRDNDSEVEVKSVVISWIILFVVVMLYSIIFRKRGFVFMPFIGFGGRGGRGGFGGGSMGGFGGFSGGGGSFGGGGAGRGF